MRDRKRTPAGGVQAEKQQRYAQLIAQGVSNAEACRLVGINRKTGTRWRYGRRVRNSAGVLVHYPPVQIKETRPRSPRYLSEQERIRIADLLSAGTTVRGAKGELALSFLNLLELKTLSMHRGDAALQAIRRALEYVGKSSASSVR
jgi:transposase, IS30 family